MSLFFLLRVELISCWERNVFRNFRHISRVWTIVANVNMSGWNKILVQIFYMIGKSAREEWVIKRLSWGGGDKSPKNTKTASPLGSPTHAHPCQAFSGVLPISHQQYSWSCTSVVVSFTERWGHHGTGGRQHRLRLNPGNRQDLAVRLAMERKFVHICFD